MKKKSIIGVLLVVVLAVAGILVHRAALAREAPAYRFAAIQRGNLQSTVSATGTLQAVTTVSVGTQVSGQVSELDVDFNDQVKKGERLARIDPTLAQQAVTDAIASLEKAQAQELQAQRDYARNSELSDSGLVARSELETTQSSRDVARAGVKSAEVAVQRARQNLTYTDILAPIDGVVVERNVQKGQTVAASLSAPQLFLIANDLAHMQILAQVGESDIAQIKEGQPVRFTVQALPGQTFDGTVQQVRLQSVTQDNVVDYTVVVAVENPQHKLLPGMTARADFLVKTADNVLEVPTAALRFKPPADAVAKTTTTTTTTTTTNTAAISQRRAASGTARQGRGAGGFGTLYVLDDQGALSPIRVRTGVTDGSMTEVKGKDLKEGMNVVIGSGTAAQTAQKSGTSPFQTSSQPSGGPRPQGSF